MEGKRRAADVVIGIGAAIGLLSALGCSDATTESGRSGLVTAGELHAAVAQLEAERTSHPDDAEVLLALGEQYRRLGRLEDSVSAYESVLFGEQVSDPEKSLALVGLGLASQTQGDFEEAVSFFEEARFVADRVGDVGAAANVRAHLGGAAHALGDFAAACTWLDEARSVESARLQWDQLACGAPPDVFAFQSAVRRVVRVSDREQRRIELAAVEPLREQAWAAYERGDADAASLGHAYADYSTALLHAGELERAAAAARGAVSLHPEDPMIHARLIVPLGLLERRAEAEAAAEAVVEQWTEYSVNAEERPDMRVYRDLAATADFGADAERFRKILDRLAERSNELVWSRRTR